VPGLLFYTWILTPPLAILQAMENSNNYILVDTSPLLAALCSELRNAPWLAVDTEFLREKTYFPKLCLVQIATPHRVACIDPLAIADITPLLELLYDPAIIKVMHAARQDMEIFYHLRSTLPQPIFDTQVAAPLLGYPDQAGYASLVEALLGVHLSKSHTRTDWSHRPLSTAQLRYAADDVRYLAELYPVLRGKLEALGRIPWLADDFAALTDPAHYDRPPEQAWLRVRGAHLLRGRRLSALQALAAWRERTARSDDQPRNWLLRDECLLDMAKIQPADTMALLRIRGINTQVVHKYGEALLEVMAESKNHEPQPLPPEHVTTRLAPGQDAIVELLLTTVRMIGEMHALHPSVITNRKELERLVQGDQTVSVLQGWRRKLAGDTLLTVLQGEAGLRVADGAVQLTRGD
jgi:ribonuclease D